MQSNENSTVALSYICALLVKDQTSHQLANPYHKHQTFLPGNKPQSP